MGRLTWPALVMRGAPTCSSGPPVAARGQALKALCYNESASVQHAVGRDSPQQQPETADKVQESYFKRHWSRGCSEAWVQLGEVTEEPHTGLGRLADPRSDSRSSSAPRRDVPGRKRNSKALGPRGRLV